MQQRRVNGNKVHLRCKYLYIEDTLLQQEAEIQYWLFSFFCVFEYTLNIYFNEDYGLLGCDAM
jgi:hypothetical protein